MGSGFTISLNLRKATILLVSISSCRCFNNFIEGIHWRKETDGASMAVILTTIVSFTAIICICLVTGLRRSITSCCRHIRDTSSNKRSAYQLSDLHEVNRIRSEEDLWNRSENKTTVGRTESEESIVVSGEKYRPNYDIVKKISFHVTDNGVQGKWISGYSRA